MMPHEFISCTRCHEQYEEDIKVARMLKCGHSVCENCLVVDSILNNCYVCKSPSFWTLSDCPINHGLMQAATQARASALFDDDTLDTIANISKIKLLLANEIKEIQKFIDQQHQIINFYEIKVNNSTGILTEYKTLYQDLVVEENKVRFQGKDSSLDEKINKIKDLVSRNNEKQEVLQKCIDKLKISSLILTNHNSMPHGVDKFDENSVRIHGNTWLPPIKYIPDGISWLPPTKYIPHYLKIGTEIKTSTQPKQLTTSEVNKVAASLDQVCIGSSTNTSKPVAAAIDPINTMKKNVQESKEDKNTWLNAELPINFTFSKSYDDTMKRVVFVKNKTIKSTLRKQLPRSDSNKSTDFELNSVWFKPFSNTTIAYNGFSFDKSKFLYFQVDGTHQYGEIFLDCYLGNCEVVRLTKHDEHCYGLCEVNKLPNMSSFTSGRLVELKKGDLFVQNDDKKFYFYVCIKNEMKGIKIGSVIQGFDNLIKDPYGGSLMYSGVLVSYFK